MSGYPTIKWFPADNKAGVDYNEGRSLEDFVKFINKEVGTKRTAAGTLNELVRGGEGGSASPNIRTKYTATWRTERMF